jgi:beta-glucosidase
LFTFGHGLSYTTFEYSDIRLSAESIRPDGEVTVTVSVANTGSRDGDEVVQLYLSDVVSSIAKPEKDLKKFNRIHLKQGETKSVSFTLGAHDLKLLGRDMKWVVEPGTFKVLIGSSSDRIALSAEFEVI